MNIHTVKEQEIDIHRKSVKAKLKEIQDSLNNEWLNALITNYHPYTGIHRSTTYQLDHLIQLDNTLTDILQLFDDFYM
jgi:hypothetical protein